MMDANSGFCGGMTLRAGAVNLRSPPEYVRIVNNGTSSFFRKQCSQIITHRGEVCLFRFCESKMYDKFRQLSSETVKKMNF
jgi:hypothetical protein